MNERGAPGERRAGPVSPSPAQRTWHEVAVKYRQALEVLEWPVPWCLPGEALECGGTAAEHAASYLGALEALVHHKIVHLHMGMLGGEITSTAYTQVVGELAALPPCEREH